MKKPTAARIASMPIDDTTTVGRWVSAYSTSSGVTATAERGRARNTTAPASAKSTAPSRSDHSAPAAANTPLAATTPSAAVTLENRASRAFVATSSSGSSTRVCTKRLLHDAGRLARDQQQQDDRIEGDLQQGDGEDETEDAAGHEEGGGDEPLRTAEAVDGRADQRRQHGERRHRDQQIEEHLLTRGVGADVEEQRPRQADRHERVTGGRQRLCRCEGHHRSPADQHPARPHVPGHALDRGRRACLVLAAVGHRPHLAACGTLPPRWAWGGGVGCARVSRCVWPARDGV